MPSQRSSTRRGPQPFPTKREAGASASSRIPGHCPRNHTGGIVSPCRSRGAGLGFFLSSGWMLNCYQSLARCASCNPGTCPLSTYLGHSRLKEPELFNRVEKRKQGSSMIQVTAEFVKGWSTMGILCYHTWSYSHSVPCWQTPVKAPIHPKLKQFVSPSPNAFKPSWWKAPPEDISPWKSCANELAGKTVSQKEDPWAAPFKIAPCIYRLLR